MSLVSVIIPSYNCERYIRQTIDSVLGQTYPHVELLIVDDGSTDATCELVEQYGDRVRLIRKSNGGVCAARNLGIREAQGDFVCLMDHDDYWYPEKLQRQIEAFARHPEYSAVYTSFQLWVQDASGQFPAPELVESTVPGDAIDESFSGWIHHLLLLDCWVLTSTAMFSKSVFEHCGVFDEALPYSEDWDLWFRIAQYTPFLKLAKATTLYRQHPLQGNRMVRPIDYRTALLHRARQRWGLASRDGRALSEWQFRRQLASYHAQFGLSHLQHPQGDRALARQSLLKAWTTFPLQLRYPAAIVASWLGWTPSYPPVSNQ
ncbi:MAG: glycosyltransferase [Candidatus Accumulibacter sp.]|uniref:glycosyltransferase family 2 protein n=1 Tax=Accumulibacter sp. TaxID=2053492 RepID=UPI002879A8EB|nr:glycosyltransferase [Accumulibacter sp.]MDS4013671.1 glycosyltransferase [Accumulibacter sp.]